MSVFAVFIKNMLDYSRLYLPNEQYPNGGKMSVALNLLTVGDMVEIKGPLGSFVWNGQGIARWKEIQHSPRRIGMICGGSGATQNLPMTKCVLRYSIGITPILQVLRGILHDPVDTETEVWLIYSNKTKDDILCDEELNELSKSHGKNRFYLHHTLSMVPENWMYSMGRINDMMLENYFPKPSSDSLVLACGPDAMIAETVKPGLSRLGWDVDRCLVVF